MRKVIYIILSMCMAAGIMYYLFQSIDMEHFWKLLKNLEVKWFVYSALIGIIAFVARGVRWSIQLEAEQLKIDGFRTFLALMSGYLINLILPRGGEVARGTFLRRNTNIPLSLLLGTILAERMLDLLILLSLFFLSLFIELDFFLDHLRPLFTVKSLFTVLKIILIVIPLVFLVIFFLKKKIAQNNRFFFRKIMRTWINFRKGIYSINKIPKKKEYIMYTLIIWVCYYFMTYIIVFSLPIPQDVPWYAGFTFLTMGAIGMSVPVQGGIGTYHAALATALALYGFQYEQGILLATAMHTTHTLVVVFIGGISIIIINFMPKLGQDKSEQYKSVKKKSYH